MARQTTEKSGEAVRLWAANELKRRWRSLVTLGLIGGLAASVSLAAVAGARRTATSFANFRQATASPDAIVFGTQVGFTDVDYTAVRRLPEVLDSGTFTLSPIALKGFPKLGSLAPGDAHLYRTLSRPSLLHGRLPDPRRDDEVLVNRAASRRYHLRVGSRVTIISATDINAFFGQVPMTGGPTVEATVVGVGDSMMDIIFGTTEPGFIPSGGFLARHGNVVPHLGNLVVRLKPGADANRFHVRAATALHLPDVPVRDLAEDAKRVTHSTDVERTALLLFAAAALMAAVVLVGQAVTRTVYAIAEAGAALRALGLARAELMSGMALTLLLAAVTAAVTAMLGAIALSSRLPVGLARTLEPSLGIRLDVPVLLIGGVAVFVLVMSGTLLAAVRATRRTAAAASPEGTSWGRRLRAIAPLPVAIGASLALEKGRGPRSLPVRPALIGAIVGVLGIVGALGVVPGID
ncbi:MAG: putative transport system permease protein, partial [Actinomycetota bacterium]|nr:putative transport system permease protein [Actinomycetota bacterium]